MVVTVSINSLFSVTDLSKLKLPVSSTPASDSVEKKGVRASHFAPIISFALADPLTLSTDPHDVAVVMLSPASRNVLLLLPGGSRRI